jgi:signal transduction histidine kinase
MAVSGTVVERPIAPRRGRQARIGQVEVHVKQHLARELHDSVAQLLTGMIIEIEQFKTEQVGRMSVLAELETLQTSTRRVLSTLRTTMRTLREGPAEPIELADWLTNLLDQFNADTGIEATFEGTETWPSPLSTHAAINLCRIIEEGLRNVRFHSGARRLNVTLSCDAQVATVRLEDDGRGLMSIGQEPWSGMGTLGMKERAALLGGLIEFHSKVGVGTTVVVHIPTEELT